MRNKDSDDRQNHENIKSRLIQLEEKKLKIQNFTDFLISTSVEDMKCSFHDSHVEENNQDCEECKCLKEKCDKFQTHNHTFTCAKKNKTITIGTNE
jgi:hypothetical protein